MGVVRRPTLHSPGCKRLSVRRGSPVASSTPGCLLGRPDRALEVGTTLARSPDAPPQPKTKWSQQEEAALVSGVKRCVEAQPPTLQHPRPPSPPASVAAWH